MKYQLIDTHAHVNFNSFKDDADEVIKRTLEQNIGLINVGSQLATSQRAVEIAHKYDHGVWAIVGLHPLHLHPQRLEYSDVAELPPTIINTRGEKFDIEAYRPLAQDSKTVAIGEVGLDYHHFEDGDPIEEYKADQKKTLLQAIILANEVQKPVMIHCWDAYTDLLTMLTEQPVNRTGAVHSFVGGYKTARKFIELGYKIGLNGVITYSNSFDRLIKEIDLTDIIIETDCPYLGPAEKKGERNEPIYVRYVAEHIARVKDLPVEQVKEQTTQNAIALFQLT
ncbi:MAG: TatD family hydrolase [Candidatus Falkowbacteria bacterium]